MLKKDFPIFEKHPDLIYLDSAATSLKPQSVIDAINDYYINYSSNSHRGIYDLAEKTTEKVEEVRIKIADFLGSKIEEVAFTPGATTGLNILYYGYLKNVPKNSRVVVLESEHNSNLLPLMKWCKEFSLKLEIVKLENSVEEIEENLIAFLDNQTVLLALNFDSNVMPLNLNFERIIQVARGLNIKVFLDACQTLAHNQIDVKKLKIDALAFSAHKLYGPTGIGAIYINENLISLLDPLIVGGGIVEDVQESEVKYYTGIKKFEAGTLNMAGIFGFGACIDYLLKIGYKSIVKQEKSLAKKLILEFEKLEFIETYPKFLKENSLFAFNVKGVHPHDAAMILNEDNVCIRASQHCTHLLHERLKINASLRVSFGVYSTKNDIDCLIDSLKKVNKYFNSIDG